MGHFVLARIRNPLKLSLKPKCLWKTSSICSNEFNMSYTYIINFPLWLENFLKKSISSGATSRSYYTYFI